MNQRQRLEATLARAEAHLQDAVKRLAEGSGASELVDKARASCRDARAELKKLDRTEH